MRKLRTKILDTVFGKKLYLRSGWFYEGTVAIFEGTVVFFQLTEKIFLFNLFLPPEFKPQRLMQH